MDLYTKTGDKGKTGIIGGRVDKDHVRVEAYGTVDELNSYIGLAVAQLTNEKFSDIVQDLQIIQHELFDAGGDLANVMKERTYKLGEASIERLETRIDALCAETPALERFILPGGTIAASTMHIARTVTRRAERQTVTLMKEIEDVTPVVQKYLNRLSDYFFAAARAVNYRDGISDIEYNNGGKVFR